MKEKQLWLLTFIHNPDSSDEMCNKYSFGCGGEKRWIRLGTQIFKLLGKSTRVRQIEETHTPFQFYSGTSPEISEVRHATKISLWW